MRNSAIIIILFLIYNIGFAQIINFTDVDLKSFLINEPCVDTIGYANGVGHIDVDLNNDNEIQVSEALSVLNLNIGHYFNHDTTIYSIKDLDFFKNLQSLDINEIDHLTEISNMDLDSLKSLHIKGCRSLELVDISNLVGLTDELRIESTLGIDYLNIQNGSVTTLFSMFYSMDVGYACIDSIAREYDIMWGHGAMLPGVLPSVNCTPLGSENETRLNNQFKVYPNPTNGIIKFSSDYSVSEFQIINMLGESSTHSNNPNHIIDLSSFSPGIYFIRFQINEKIIIKRVILH